jgi:tetratricopeptide (TPR) repeat protein
VELTMQNNNGMELLDSMPETEDLGIEDNGNQESEEMSSEFPLEIGESSLNEDQEAAMAWLESLAEIEGANKEELLTINEERSHEPPEWIKNSIGEIDDNLVADRPSSNSDLIVIKKSDVINALNNQESMESELSKAQESAQIFEQLAKNEKSEDMEMFTSGIVELTGKSSAEQNWNTEESELESLAPTSSVVEDEGHEDIIQDEQTINNEIEESIGTENDYSSEPDIPKWLSDLDQRDTKITEDTITPKESENYGNEDTEQLPDWLRNIDTGSKTSGWISESEALSDENYPQSSNSELSAQEKDIEDIREIFPAEDTNWNLEKSESESKLEPKNEEVNPVSSGDWQSVQQDQTISDQKIADDFDSGMGFQDAQSFQKRLPSGEGSLSKIPDQGVEKEAGILELAQNFLESGDIKKALDLYAKLVKKGQLLEGVIHDLRETTYRYPLEIGVWQLLGDAYMRSNRLQDALDAYTKAEELLR